MRYLGIVVLLAHAIVITGSAAAAEHATSLDRHGDPLPTGAVARLGSVPAFQPPGHVVAARFHPMV